MEAYEYNEVKVDDADEENNATSWIPLMRQVVCSALIIFIGLQLFVCSGAFSIYFVLGLSFGAPTVFIPQIRSEGNSTVDLSDDMTTWLSSVHGYSAVPWVLIIPEFSRRVGRKIPFLIVCVNTLVSFIVFYFSTNTVQLLISEIMVGMLLASNITLLVVIITEYTSPRYRGVALAIESAVFFWGVWVANVTGTFLHWKNIGIIALLCSVYSLTAVVWPESPSWLALKGRFDECVAAHHWLKGYDRDSEKELKNLIHAQKEYLRIRAQRLERSSRCRLKNIVETISTKAFYKPLLLSMSVMSLYHFSGKFVCGVYAVDLIKQITDSEFTAYVGMLIMDGVTILGMQIGCTLCKFLNRRTLLIGSSVIGVMFLFIISLYLFLISMAVIVENKLLTIFLLTSFSVSISCGPIIIPSCLFGELIFLRYKSSSLLLLTLFSEILMATILKLSPYIFTLLTLQGTFLFFAISASTFLLILYKYLPETKDKTLQEIELFFQEPSKSDHVSGILMDDQENIDSRLRDET